MCVCARACVCVGVKDRFKTWTDLKAGQFQNRPDIYIIIYIYMFVDTCTAVLHRL